jgi:hypothetical protein
LRGKEGRVGDCDADRNDDDDDDEDTDNDSIDLCFFSREEFCSFDVEASSSELFCVKDDILCCKGEGKLTPLFKVLESFVKDEGEN